MPKSISSNYESENLDSVKACCNVFDCRELVILPQYSAIQVFRIETDTQLSFFLWDRDRAAYPFCGYDDFGL